MRFFSLLIPITFLSLSSCSSTKKAEGEEVTGPLPPPDVEATAETEVEGLIEGPEEIQIAKTEPAEELPKLDPSAPDLSTVGKWKRRSPVEQLPGQKELAPSLAPVTLPVNEGSQVTEELSGTLAVQP